MIEKMHEKTNSFAFKVIFSLVSLSFVLGGIGGTLLGQDTSAVKVNGEEISQQAFNAAKNRQQNLLNQQLGERFWDALDNPEYVKQFNDSILNELIDNELLRQYASSLKMGISVNQIKQEIVNTPSFQRDGKFDNALYQQLLVNNNLSADQYASIVSEGMLFSQLQEGIINSDFILPIQKELLAKLLFQKRTVRLATYSVAKEMANQTASNEELQAYFDTHKTSFINPEKFTVEYVSITPKDFADKIQVTQEQIENYYQTNKANYISPSEVKVAHIQLANEESARTVEQQLKSGTDFATLAKEKSLDKLSGSNGGELGWAKSGTYPKAFEDAMNTLAVGQVSEPIKVDDGYSIIKVLERKESKVVPVEQVKEQITDIIRNELATVDYSNMAREMANKAFENSSSLEAVAELANTKVQQTTEFTRENVPQELNNEKILKVLFSGDLSQTGQNSDAIDLSEGNHSETIFVRVSNYKAQSNQTFDEAKNALEVAVKREKAEKILMAKAQEDVKALASDKAHSVNFEPAQTLVFAQAQVTQPLLSKLIFAMPKPTQVSQYQAMKNNAGDIVVVALDKVEDGNLADFQQLEKPFIQTERATLRSDLLQDLRGRAKIEFNEEFIGQMNNSEK
ncbi:peptidylprolyl isomerase [Vespertiliibacter pulmonis]|uniref:Periplasmic chaperone PpiD n=1 Tax=Vespertiliibacter pulmonis TaxID=1443036 RepID=A0A3N4VQJ8_9PAST|nr:SurA N-terminal domain-containing protein [Vespertiliibacter pulmonis]QLB21059.1 peptidylprolyl isomerase [Vespertiliibacter pulmonis]RPE83843.1 peptidyl-prolyl cis-trans isomerase D [Vespertiliibacter pulmonis]